MGSSIENCTVQATLGTNFSAVKATTSTSVLDYNIYSDAVCAVAQRHGQREQYGT